MKIRLDKYLADAGYGTRNQVKALVKTGKISINGSICRDSSEKVDTALDDIRVNGEKAAYSEYEYYMLHKPAGIITASRDKNEKTVLDLISSKKRRDLFPVGRLDRDTEGLLLITNDGELSHRLLAPGKHVDKIYSVIVQGNVPENIESLFKSGIDIGDDTPAKPAKLKAYTGPDEFLKDYNDPLFIEKYNSLLNSDNISADNLSLFEIILTEGRYHEIKRMFEAVGCTVVYLKRYSMGSLMLDLRLAPGKYRELTSSELEALNKHL